MTYEQHELTSATEMAVNFVRREKDAEIARIMGLINKHHDESEFCERTAIGNLLFAIENGEKP